ncbi:hypothetical protein BHE74_00022723, partial [Ensete ventricosum]
LEEAAFSVGVDEWQRVDQVGTKDRSKLASTVHLPFAYKNAPHQQVKVERTRKKQQTAITYTSFRLVLQFSFKLFVLEDCSAVFISGRSSERADKSYTFIFFCRLLREHRRIDRRRKYGRRRQEKKKKKRRREKRLREEMKREERVGESEREEQMGDEGRRRKEMRREERGGEEMGREGEATRVETVPAGGKQATIGHVERPAGQHLVASGSGGLGLRLLSQRRLWVFVFSFYINPTEVTR